MRMLILAAVAALIAAPGFAAETNGNTGEVYQPGTVTPPASGAAGTAGNAGDLATPGNRNPVGSGGGQAGLRSQGSTPNTNRPMSDTPPSQ